MAPGELSGCDTPLAELDLFDGRGRPLYAFPPSLVVLRNQGMGLIGCPNWIYRGDRLSHEERTYGPILYSRRRHRVRRARLR